MRLHCVDDGAPAVTLRLLRIACEARGVEFIRVDAPRFDFDAARRAHAGDALVRPAVSVAARRVEQFLHAPGVATFHARDDGLLFPAWHWPLVHARAGVPVPRTIPCASSDRALLRRFATELGGPPVVVKVPGGSGGIGVMRADSLAALFSLADFLLARGLDPVLSAYVPDTTPWRVIVVGDDAVAGHRGSLAAGDFRSSGAPVPDAEPDGTPPALGRLAVRAVHVLGLEHGGVDVLETASGDLVVLEVNFPCFFAQAQQVTGVDVAGRMVEHLVAKAAREGRAHSR